MNEVEIEKKIVSLKEENGELLFKKNLKDFLEMEKEAKKECKDFSKYIYPDLSLYKSYDGKFIFLQMGEQIFRRGGTIKIDNEEESFKNFVVIKNYSEIFLFKKETIQNYKNIKSKYNSLYFDEKEIVLPRRFRGLPYKLFSFSSFFSDRENLEKFAKEINKSFKKEVSKFFEGCENERKKRFSFLEKEKPGIIGIEENKRNNFRVLFALGENKKRIKKISAKNIFSILANITNNGGIQVEGLFIKKELITSFLDIKKIESDFFDIESNERYPYFYRVSIKKEIFASPNSLNLNPNSAEKLFKAAEKYNLEDYVAWRMLIELQ